MNWLNAALPIGRWFGINVRLHLSLLVYGYWWAMSFRPMWFGAACVVGLWLCILLHEFGHALAARWCDGEANEILLWPLGGLAFVRPAFNPTAHLITTVAGPFVTLVLWLTFKAILWTYWHLFGGGLPLPPYAIDFLVAMRSWNLFLLLFNMIPAFPMDGGRIVRDTIWLWTSAERATKIAVTLSHLIAAATAVLGILGLLDLYSLPALPLSPTSLLILAAFIFWQTSRETSFIVGYEARGAYSFSVRERIQRMRRQRAFHQAVRERHTQRTATGFHRCATCGRTEMDAPSLEFRVCSECSGGEEYCGEHLRTHKHL